MTNSHILQENGFLTKLKENIFVEEKIHFLNENI